MGEEVKMSEYEPTYDGDGDCGGCDDDKVLEWEIGLPSGEDLTPLSQSLISPELASAFSIFPERARTIRDVDWASRTTISVLRNGSHALSVEEVAEEEEEDPLESSFAGSDQKKQKKSDGRDAVVGEGDSGTEDPAAGTMKRPRLVWTPQLHKRFVEVVAHLGIKNAVPKTIMQLMNVEGLTRENVASHLQKYRLYLKRKQGGLTTEHPSSSEKLFSSPPVTPQSYHGGGGDGPVGMPIPMPYGPPQGIMSVPVYGHMGVQGYHHYHNPNLGHDRYHQNHHHGGGGFESNPYMMQQRDWPGNKYGSVAPYPPVGGGGANEN